MFLKRLFLILPLCLSVTPANADRVFWEKTELFDLSIGTTGYDAVRGFSRNIAPLSNGDIQSLGEFYQPYYPDINLTLGTYLENGLVFTWGFSTGSSGDKFKVNPSLNLGLTYVQSFGENTNLTLYFTQTLFGGVKEKPCVGNYGAIGGLQKVNCRLAATPLPPERTLDFLLNEKNLNETRVGFIFTYRF